MEEIFCAEILIAVILKCIIKWIRNGGLKFKRSGTYFVSLYFILCSQWIFFSCEYVVLREHGVTKGGNEVDEIVRFHGDKTEDVYVSQTNKVLLQFCYRSETFSARNMQITYGAVGKYSLNTNFVKLNIILPSNDGKMQ